MSILEADVVVIGSGITGCMIARELSRYRVSIILLEKGSDVAQGSSRANTAIIHAGYDADPRTWKGKLNAKGNAMYRQLAEELDVHFSQIGSLVVALEESEIPILEDLMKRGRENGVKGLEIVNREWLLRREPNLNPKALAALWAPTAGIICPYEMVIALAENAVANGVRFLRETPAAGIVVEDGQVRGVMTNRGFIRTGFVVNAAGLYADEIAKMAGDDSFRIIPRKGEYHVLDKRMGDLVRTVLFPVPTKISKGVVVTPTVDGNVLVGPDARDVDDKEDVSTTPEGLAGVMREARRLIPDIPVREAITQYAGLRAVATGDDFIIGPSERVRGFFNAAGIQSPGLSSAPAIAEVIIDMLRDTGLRLVPRPDFNPVRKGIRRFSQLSMSERAKAVWRNPDYGQIICRCELVTKAEIVEAIRRSPGATTIDGIKMRTRAGMGRCQGGFCGPRVLAILSQELRIPPEKVTKNGGSSYILNCKTKEPLLYIK